MVVARLVRKLGIRNPLDVFNERMAAEAAARKANVEVRFPQASAH